MTRYDEQIERLRAAAPREKAAPPGLAVYLEKVRTRAYAVTDAEVQALKEGGVTEDEIFEATVAAAVTAGLERLDAGLAALRG